MNFQSPVVTLLGRTASFDLALASADLLGVVGKVASPTIKFYPPSCVVGILPLMFSFTRCISTPWIFSFIGFSSVSDLDNQSRDLL